MEPRFRLAAITDEFSPNLKIALQGMTAAMLRGAELRMIFGKNVVDLSDDEVDRAIDMIRGRDFEIVSIASPLLKCELPGAPPIDARFQQDVFASHHNFDDQPRLAERTFEIARRAGARVIRVFSYWRTVDPAACFDRIAEAMRALAEQAAAQDLIIGVENEHACNVSTGEDVARLLAAVDHPNLQVVWDPANALVAGETPYPDGYDKLPFGRVAHVHAKDCRLHEGQPVWGPLGVCGVDWPGHMAALARDGYKGWISLETHWSGSGGDKMQASALCAHHLTVLASGGRIRLANAPVSAS